MIGFSLLLLFLLYFTLNNSQISFADNEFRPFLPIEMSHTAAGIHNDELIVLGGLAREGINPIAQQQIYTLDLSSLEVNQSWGVEVNDVNLQWQQYGTDAAGEIICSGTVQSSVQIGSKLYITYWTNRLDDPAFAVGNFQVSQMAIFDLSTKSYIDKSAATPKADTFACTMSDHTKYIWVLGGDDASISSADGGNTNTYYYDIDTSVWTQGDSLSINRWNSGI